MRFRPWPRSLAARTALVLLTGLTLVQMLGLTIHAFDRIDLQRFAQTRVVAAHVMNVYRAIVMTPPPQRMNAAHTIGLPKEYTAALSAAPPLSDMPETPAALQRLLRADMAVAPLSGLIRPRDYVLLGGFGRRRLLIGLKLPDGTWLNVGAPLEPPRPWESGTFLFAFVLMTAAAAVLTWWAVRRLLRPVRMLAVAAETLGRDVNAPPLDERGPTETATAARAFNTMASRIRRFVQDRTEMLTAIGHDLRTPITRLKLRTEFVDDDELRRKMLNDLEELEAMVSATLAFGRDAKNSEPVSPIDVAELLRTILDEAGDAAPSAAHRLDYTGPAHLTVRARPLSLKRCLANLVSNAVKYGGAARVTLTPPAPVGVAAGMVRIDIEDDGPGIPNEELERVFEPFHRVETSRNRETGGVGLGLPIARNILRAHGGDVTLTNRQPAGARATVTLPA